MSGAGQMIAGTVMLGLLYISLAPRVATPLYRSLLFHPDKYPAGNYDLASIDGVARKDVFFTSHDGTALHGWYFALPGARETILFHHGNAGNITTRAPVIQLLLEAGASVFIYDYREYGRSAGVTTIKGICDDGCAAFDYLTQVEGINPDDIINYGESLGCAVACQVSTVRRGCGLILQSGFSSLRKIGISVCPWVILYPPILFPQPDLDNIPILKQHHPPLLILHGVNDGVVPLDHGEEMFAAASEPKRFVALPGADHNDISMAEPALYQRAIRDYIATLCGADICGDTSPTR